ncbi:LOW QUALITY PROTEIN: interferon-induced protein 44-like [Boleophthalmus pectinirostris]|uniref:LOW QUALITY PROTEIN: interferon-induced protein 44-like n=1 Tax=Boleophthalmus pectinirostris TaxID=150288 RepID=UPI00242EC916|nr:LOW QUALITY PROTEIN: interferon-induced protein 44-like [Boleophthalmus pectinirostris]
MPPMKKDDYLKYFGDFQLDETDAQHIRILLYGPINAGKSSFINAVETTLRGRMTAQALVGNDEFSFTTKYRTHKICKEKPRTFYPFVFNDIMGLETGQNRGVCVDDIKLAMKGHLKDGLEFNPQSPCKSTNPHYNSSPTLNDRTHVLVCVVPADKLSVMSDEYLKKIKEVRLAARDFEIPQVAILTKIDVSCPEVKADIKNVYRSKYVKKLMEKLSVSVGVPLNCIFPVKNYHSELCTDEEMEKLILTALKQMIDFGEDFCEQLHTSAGVQSVPQTVS